MNKKLFFIAIFIFFIPFLTSAQSAWKLKSYNVSFKIKNAGFKVDGYFKTLTTQVAFAPEQLATSKITASIQATSIQTGNNTRDNHLRKEEYFDVEKHPTLVMQSVSFTGSNQNFVGKFNLTIKGVTKTIDVPFTFIPTDNQAIFKGSFEINRRDFGVGGSSMMMSDDVAVILEITVVK